MHSRGVSRSISLHTPIGCERKNWIIRKEWMNKKKKEKNLKKVTTVLPRYNGPIGNPQIWLLYPGAVISKFSRLELLRLSSFILRITSDEILFLFIIETMVHAYRKI